MTNGEKIERAMRLLEDVAVDLWGEGDAVYPPGYGMVPSYYATPQEREIQSVLMAMVNELEKVKEKVT